MEEIKTRYIHDDLKKMRVFRDSILQTFWRMDGSSGMHYHCATSAITWMMATLPVFNPFPNKPWFLRVYGKHLLKTLWEKEKLLVTSNFSFFHSVFYSFGKLFAIFIKLKIVICKPFEFGRV